MTPSEIALQWVGQKELAGNKFLDSTEIGKLIHAAGQKDGEAYCAYTQEALFKKANPEKMDEYSRLFNASAVQTFMNFKDAGYTIVFIPAVDHLVVWQKYANGKADWRGHCGNVMAVKGNKFDSFEGNTGSGDPREGDGFYIKSHSADGAAFTVNTGLRLLGFIKLI